VTLTTAEPREYHAADVESLTQQVLGFRLPLGGLADWVRGRPSPDLERRGWRIEYQEYAAELPSRCGCSTRESSCGSSSRGGNDWYPAPGKLIFSCTCSACERTAITSCRPCFA